MQLLEFASPAPATMTARVDLWHIDIAATPADTPLLATDERERADRRRHPAVRRRFVAGRQALRSILARYVGLPAPQLRLAADGEGKPYVEGRGDISFSFAHSHDRAMLAVTNGVALGVDIERISPSPQDEKIAQAFFAAEERHDLAMMPEALRTAAFFAVWARKEAVAKAAGGIGAMPFDRFAVSTRPDEPPHILRVAGSNPAEWTLIDTAPDDRHASALAVRCPDVLVRHRMYA